MERNPNRRWVLIRTAWVLALLLCAPLIGCAHLATPEEKEVSFKRFAALTVADVPLGDYLDRRTAVVIAGAEPVVVRGSYQKQSNSVEVRLKPTSREGFDVGSASAVAADGYYLTAAHCVGRQPLYLLMPDKDEPRIVSARVVWKPAQKDPATDFAILKAEAPAPAVFEVAPDPELGVGQDVVTSGANGLAGGTLQQVVNVANPTSNAPRVTAVVHDAPLAQGDSGGPLATSTGRLIGVEVLARGLFLGRTQGIALRPDPEWVKQVIRNDRDHPR